MRTAWQNWLTWWVLLASTWLLLVAKVDTQDAIAAVVTGAIGASTALLITRAGAPEFDARVGWVAKAARLPGKILKDTATVSKAFVERIAGQPSRAGYSDIPFDPGGDDPESRARRAAVTVITSMSPNAYLVGIGQNTLRTHQLVKESQDVGDDRRWPV